MRIVVNLVIFILLTFQNSYAFNIKELIETKRVDEMQLSISGGAASGSIYFDKVDQPGYCVINYVEFDEALTEEDIISKKFVALTSCDVAARSDFSVELNNITKVREKAAISILKEMQSCSAEKCFQKSPESTLLTSLLPIYPSVVSFINKEYAVKVVMSHLDKDYYFYFSADGKRLTHISAVDSFAPDNAEF